MTVAKLADMTSAQRRLIEALIAAQKKAAPVSETSGTASAEVQRGSAERSAA
jgi:hypothetical protein